MIEGMEDVPEGTVGLRARGKLTQSDYVDVLEPAMKEAVEFRHRSDWKKLAFVSDSEWVGKALHAFAWLTPGEVHIYPMDKLEEAKSWAAA